MLDCVLFCSKENMGKNFFSIIVVVLFATIAGFSLLHSGLPPTHDGEYHVIRFFLFNEALTDGNLYPRWASRLNNNFGLPLFTFVYPLPNYAAAAFHLFGISFIDSFKLEMFVAIIIGGIFSYLWAKEFWGRLGGIVSSIFYTFSPYHFADIYIRGSVGEVWALAFFPAFLWAYTLFIKSNKNFYLALSSILLSLIIFSHNILAFMFAAFVFSYMLFVILFNKNKIRLIFKSFLILLMGFGLSAIFWLPAIYETKFVTGLQIFDIASHFPDLYQLLIPSWGSGFSGAGLQNELSFQIGIANLIAVFLSLTAVFVQIIRKNKVFFHIIFFLISFIIVLFLMLETSLPIWKIIPLMNYFQFPWRLLSLEILFASFLAGSFVYLFKNKTIKIFSSMFLIGLALFLGIGYAKPAYYMYRNDNYYTARSNFIDGTNSPGNVFNTVLLKTIPNKEKERSVFLKGKGSVVLNQGKSSKYIFKISSQENSKILINLAYYPGWEVYVNNKKTDIQQMQNGRFAFFLPSGESKVEVVFKDTLIRKFAALISFASLIFILTLFIQHLLKTPKYVHLIRKGAGFIKSRFATINK